MSESESERDFLRAAVAKMLKGEDRKHGGMRGCCVRDKRREEGRE